MRTTSRLATTTLVVLTLFGTSAHAAGYISKSTVVGNNVTITSSGGTTTVNASNSCSTGVTGYLYQSVLVLFGGATYAATQSNTCP